MRAVAAEDGRMSEDDRMSEDGSTAEDRQTDKQTDSMPEDRVRPVEL